MSEPVPIPENIAPRRRRPVGRVVAAVVLGLVLTLASAWVPAVLEAWTTRPGAGVGPLALVYRVPEPGGDREFLLVHRPRAGCESWMTIPVDPKLLSDSSAIQPRAADWPVGLLPPEGMQTTGVSLYGWPRRCMRFNTTSGVVGTATTVSSHGVVVVPLGSLRAHLPVRPVWSGLGTNMLLSTMVAGVLLFLPGAARGWWRVKKKRCRGCGYPLAGIGPAQEVCPECGAATKDARS